MIAPHHSRRGRRRWPAPVARQPARRPAPLPVRLVPAPHHDVPDVLPALRPTLWTHEYSCPVATWAAADRAARARLPMPWLELLGYAAASVAVGAFVLVAVLR